MIFNILMYIYKLISILPVLYIPYILLYNNNIKAIVLTHIYLWMQLSLHVFEAKIFQKVSKVSINTST